MKAERVTTVTTLTDEQKKKLDESFKIAGEFNKYFEEHPEHKSKTMQKMIDTLKGKKP